MPRSATKAANNPFYIARREAAKHNDRLWSREGAEEEMGIDRTRLAKIESGALTPYPEEVWLMSQTYNAPQLCNQFCSRECPLGRETIPPCDLLELDRLTVEVMAAMRKAGFTEETILDIAEDGAITQEEVPRLQKAAESLEAMEKASVALRLWISKYIEQETRK